MGPLCSRLLAWKREAKKVSDDAEAHVAQDDSEEEPVVLMVTTSEE